MLYSWLYIWSQISYLNTPNYESFTLGSTQAYNKSTKIFTTTNTKAINKIEPITTGKSDISKELTVVHPKPLYPNIYSTKNEPANKDANQPDIAVITGFKAFFKACL